jgi:hypothetical protein
MPVKRVVDTNEKPDTIEDSTELIRAAVSNHAGSTRWLRARRKRSGGGRTWLPALATKIAFSPEQNEDVDELAREAAEAIMDVITTDAGGEQWNGEVDLLGEEARFGKHKIVASVDVLLEGETVASPAVAKQRAEADTMASQAKTIDGLGAALVKLANAKASDAEAMAKVVASVGEMVGRERKWDYKIAREKEETEREEIKERASTTRSRARWDAFETLLEEYKDVAKIWSVWWTEARKPGGPPPQRPTSEEIAKVFGDERLEANVVLEDGTSANLRAIVSEMIAEPDTRRRVLLAKTLTKVLNALPTETQELLKMQMAVQLGVERAKEVAAWLSLPIS